MKRIVVTLCALMHLALAGAAEPFVVFEPQSDALSLKTVSISFSEQDYEGVKIAIGNLQNDLKNVRRPFRRGRRRPEPRTGGVRPHGTRSSH